MSYRFTAALTAMLLVMPVMADGELRLNLTDGISRPLHAPLPASASVPTSAVPLPLAQAIRLALENQPLLAEKSAAITSSEQSAIAAGQLPDPRVTLGLANVPSTLSLTEESMTSANIGIEQVIPGGDKRRLNTERAQLETERNSVALEETRRSVARDAALAWLSWFQPLQAKLLVQGLQREAQIQLEWQRIALSTGKTNLQQVLAVQSTLDLLHDREAELDHQWVMAQAEMARWVGPVATQTLPDALPQAVSMPELPALRERLTTHPQLTILEKVIAAAQADVALAREATKSDWSVGASYGYRSAGRSDLISLQVARDLPFFPENRQNRGVAAKQALLEQARAQREDRLRTLSAELEKTYIEWHASRERTAWFDSIVLPRAAQRVEAALAGYQAGQGDLAMVLDARRAELETRLQRLALRVAQTRAETQLQYFAQ
jgi:outer membrane protein TolC